MIISCYKIDIQKGQEMILNKEKQPSSEKCVEGMNLEENKERFVATSKMINHNERPKFNNFHQADEAGLCVICFANSIEMMLPCLVMFLIEFIEILFSNKYDLAWIL